LEKREKVIVLPAAKVAAAGFEIVIGQKTIIAIPRLLRQANLAGIEQPFGTKQLLLGPVARGVSFGRQPLGLVEGCLRLPFLLPGLRRVPYGGLPLFGFVLASLLRQIPLVPCFR